MRVTLLIPTLNEIEGMRVIMPQIEREWYHQLIVIDGGSTDETVAYCDEHGYFLLQQDRPGVRGAFLTALPLVEGDVIIEFSPDGNSLPHGIPKLAAKMEEGYDMVIASRYLDGAVSEDDDAITAFGNGLFTTLTNVLLGGRYTDVMVMFRAYRTALLGELGLDREDDFTTPERLFGTVLGWEPLLSFRAARRGCKVTEIGVDEPARIGGARKLQVVRWGLAYMYQLLRERFVRW